MILTIIIIGIVVQTGLQWFIDTSVCSLIFRSFAYKIRYLMATNFPFRTAWNVITGVAVSTALFGGTMGLYTSIIFLSANGIYWIISKIFLYGRWIEDYQQSDRLTFESMEKARIRKIIKKRARKAGVKNLYHDEIEELVEKEFKRLKSEELKSKMKEDDFKKREFKDRIRSGGLE